MSDIPEVVVGELVHFYSDGRVFDGAARIAYVMSVNARSIDLSCGGLHFENVKHTDDPRLTNKDQRSAGVWKQTEFSEKMKSQLQSVPQLEAKIEALESEVDSLKSSIKSLHGKVSNIGKAKK